jgi:hypothetical protein
VDAEDTGEEITSGTQEGDATTSPEVNGGSGSEEDDMLG